MLAVFGWSAIGRALLELYSGELMDSLVNLGLLLVMIIFYAKGLSVLLPWLGFERVSAAGLISKVAITVLSFQLWMVLSEFFREYSPM